ncbi:MAG: type II secretion system secretin GspD [Sedimenticola sp.]
MTLNLNNADIRAFISTVSEMTGKTFIIDPRVKGNVTVVSAAPVAPDSIYEIFVSVLKVHGYAVVPSGEAIKILPQAYASKDSAPLVSARVTGNGDKLVTRVIKIHHADAVQMVPILRPLLPQQAHLAAHPTSNTLVVADSAANVNRVAEIAKRMDRPSDLDVDIIPLRHSQASELAETLASLVKKSTAKSGKGPVDNTLIADVRTNSLILGGDSGWRSSIRLLIAQLDREVSNEGDTEVIPLRFADARELLDVLRGVGDQQLKSDVDKDSNRLAGAGGRFDIQADEATNSLVITAPPFLMRSLKSVVSELDVRRAQVLIEAIIAELRYDKSVEFGVEWESGMPGNGFGGGTSLPLASGVGSLINGYPTTIGSGFSLGYFRGGDLRLLLKAFSGSSDANILSTPSLVTLDNEEASIHVGQNVPFVTGQYTNDAAGATNPFQTIERHDVGVKLKVTPHISEGETVKLKIEQEISSVDSSSTVDGLVTNKRLIETTILVDNEEVVVLGGLMEDSLTDNESKVPVLGDIPMLGTLFKNQRSALEKKNLMVFLRPQIIRDQKRSSELAARRYTHIRNLQREAKEEGVPLMPGEEPPVLPEMKTGEPVSHMPDGHSFLQIDTKREDASADTGSGGSRDRAAVVSKSKPPRSGPTAREIFEMLNAGG